MNRHPIWMAIASARSVRPEIANDPGESQV